MRMSLVKVNANSMMTFTLTSDHKFQSLIRQDPLVFVRESLKVPLYFVRE